MSNEDFFSKINMLFWTKINLFIFQADERLLLQVPDLLYSVPPSKVFSMRQQTQILWDRYLSSVEKIVHTTFEVGIKSKLVFKMTFSRQTKSLQLFYRIPIVFIANSISVIWSECRRFAIKKKKNLKLGFFKFQF